MDIKKIVTYWQSTAAEDLVIAHNLFTLKHYSACLFFCHLTLEKLLKGIVVVHTKQHAPYIHSLTTLAERAGIQLTTTQREELKIISSFNIAGRYDSIKLELHHKATKQLTTHYLELTQQYYYLWLKKSYQKK